MMMMSDDELLLLKAVCRIVATVSNLERRSRFKALEANYFLKMEDHPGKSKNVSRRIAPL
jgi:hypothetical protein